MGKISRISIFFALPVVLFLLVFAVLSWKQLTTHGEARLMPSLEAAGSLLLVGIFWLLSVLLTAIAVWRKEQGTRRAIVANGWTLILIAWVVVAAFMFQRCIEELRLGL
jgi:hypothetical protein